MALRVPSGRLHVAPRFPRSCLCGARHASRSRSVWAFPSPPPRSSWLTSTPPLWEVLSETSRLAESPNAAPHVHSVLTWLCYARPRCSCWFPFTGRQWQDLQSLSEWTLAANVQRGSEKPWALKCNCLGPQICLWEAFKWKKGPLSYQVSNT